jgi:SAM-dependent methyltransferase
VLATLTDKCGLLRQAVVADIGSGTGTSSKLFLENGNTVYAVEPLAEMRAAAERTLSAFPNFISIAGSAEETKLAPNSVDVVVAGQAAHMFDPNRVRSEFARILKPRGWIVIIWNERRRDGTPFLREYEDLLQSFGMAYPEPHSRHMNLCRFRKFIGSEAAQMVTLDNIQRFDLQGALGKLLFSSHAPTAGQAEYEVITERLEKIFQARQHDGRVAFEYDTHIFYGQLPSR